MARLVGFDLVDDANRPESLLHRDDIAAVIAAARGEDHLLEPGFLVRACVKSND